MLTYDLLTAASRCVPLCGIAYLCIQYYFKLFCSSHLIYTITILLTEDSEYSLGCVVLDVTDPLDDTDIRGCMLRSATKFI